MVTEALTAAGRNPTGLAGGRVAAWGGNARIGGDELFVVEADEYDKAFLSLKPTIAVVNNVEADISSVTAASTRSRKRSRICGPGRARDCRCRRRGRRSSGIEG